jgi:DNA-binding response OmpR family regulator
MTKTVLDVGNCNPDHYAIRDMLKSSFSVNVLRADQLSDALDILNRESVDLVLVNRKLDIDYSDGMDIISTLLGHTKFQSIPVMLVTNLEEHQTAAIEAGAKAGFGKSSLRTPETHSRLAAVLEA